MTDKLNDRIETVIELDSPLSRVWSALTDHKEFGQWFRVQLDQPFEIHSISTGHITFPGHEGVPWFAYIERMDPAHLFAFRWYDSDVSSLDQIKDEAGILVEFQLEEIPNGTSLTITESGFSTLPESRRSELMRDNTEGWNIQTKNLATYLAT